MTDDLDITIPLMPFDVDLLDAPRAAVLSSQPFAYIGQALSGEEFVDYVRGYDFGSVPPDYVVIHNTANPDASWAKLNNDPLIKWDRNEAGLSESQIKAKRKSQLDAIKNYYISQGWTTGPHLFVDERWIWLFTPMYEIGTHSKSGNSYHDAAGKLHYSVGIETVGYFEQSGWPQSMQTLLQIAVQTLRDRLHTFEIVYKTGPTNTPSAHAQSISFHRDYNKPGCPGAMISPEYAIPILRTPYAAPATHTATAGPFGAIARTDYRGSGLAAAYFPPGAQIVVDDFHTNEYRHAASGVGFIADGDVTL